MDIGSVLATQILPAFQAKPALRDGQGGPQGLGMGREDIRGLGMGREDPRGLGMGRGDLARSAGTPGLAGDGLRW